jgi:hypothetical protein
LIGRYARATRPTVKRLTPILRALDGVGEQVLREIERPFAVAPVGLAVVTSARLSAGDSVSTREMSKQLSGPSWPLLLRLVLGIHGSPNKPGITD